MSVIPAIRRLHHVNAKESALIEASCSKMMIGVVQCKEDGASESKCRDMITEGIDSILASRVPKILRREPPIEEEGYMKDHMVISFSIVISEDEVKCDIVKCLIAEESFIKGSWMEVLNVTHCPYNATVYHQILSNNYIEKINGISSSVSIEVSKSGHIVHAGVL